MELFYDVDYSKALHSQFGGGNAYSDRYVFNSQEGDGFGSAFSAIGAMALPTLKKLLPFLKSLGGAAIKGGVDYALNKTVDSTKKRKVRRRIAKNKHKRTRHV